MGCRHWLARMLRAASPAVRWMRAWRVVLVLALVIHSRMARRADRGKASQCRRAPGVASGFEVTTHGGQRGTGIDAVAWSARAAGLGAGEILLNSMDADGTKAGFDTVLIRGVRAAVTVPVIASGGAGELGHFPAAVAAGADAVLAASVFHFGTLRIAEVKSVLRGAGYPVR